MPQGYATLGTMDVHPGDIIQIDTLLGGIPGITCVQLVRGESPALIDCGTQTSVETVRRGLSDAGLGPDDLAWLVLTCPRTNSTRSAERRTSSMLASSTRGIRVDPRGG